MNKAATTTIKIPTALRNLHKYGANALKPTKLINTTQARQRWKKPYVSKRIANTLRKKAIREGTYGTYDAENGVGWDKEWDNCVTFDKSRDGNSVGVGAGKSYNEVDITGAILAKAAARLKARNNLKINTNIDVNTVSTNTENTENTSMDIININPNANTNNIMNGGNIKYMDLRKPKETKRERTREARAKKIEDMLLNADDKILEYRLKQKDKKPEPGIEALIKRQMRVS